MSRYAVIQNNSVINIIESNAEEVNKIKDDYKYILCSEEVKIGDGYIDNNFQISLTMDDKIKECDKEIRKVADNMTQLTSRIELLERTIADLILSSESSN